VFLRNKSPSHALGNKTPYKMWYDRIPSVRHLKVFGFTYYALIPKEQRFKLGARSRKCFFLRYSNISKAYRLYDEVNKKVLYVVFLESTKNDKVIECQLDHLDDKFTYVKAYHEFDNEIPHLEGGVPILDQSMNLLLNCHLSFMYKIQPLHQNRKFN
jgi:hypothetical protein